MLTRRSFLQFVVGGTLGAIFSPLPWRMLDELALFSQRWTPQGAPGEETWHYAVCQLCPGRCGLKVRKINERVVQVEPNPFNPLSDGICPLGAASVQYLYGVQRRVKRPLKRVRDRGQNRWQEIGWDEALRLIAQKLGELKNSGATEGLAIIDGSVSGLMQVLLKKFAKDYGSANYFHIDYDSGTALALKRVLQTEGEVGFDLENADYVLSFGSQILEGWGAPGKLPTIYAKWQLHSPRPRAKFIQIEPRLSETAAKASQWLPILPGTEAILALGLANVIVNKGLYRFELVSSGGFEPFKKFVSKFDLNAVALKTGLTPQQIEKLAVEFAQAKHPIAIWGRGKGHNSTGACEAAAILMLNALVGNLNRPGGVFVFEDDLNKVFPEVASLRPQNLVSFLDNVANKKSYVEMLFVCEANPAYKLPLSYQKALNNIDFVVVATPFLNDTAIDADLVLPSAFYLERWEAATSPKGLPYSALAISAPVTKPYGDARHPGDVVLALAKSQRLNWTLTNYRQFLKKAVEGIWNLGQGKLLKGKEQLRLPSSPRKMWQALQIGVWIKEVSPKPITRVNLEFMPKVGEGEVWNIKGNDKEFPLTLVPAEYSVMAEDLGNAPYLMKQLPDTVLKGDKLCVSVNPETGLKCGLKDKAKAHLKTPFGQAQVMVVFDETVRPGVVLIPVGLGHKGYDKYLANKGINAYAMLGLAKDKMGISSYVMGRVNLVKI